MPYLIKTEYPCCNTSSRFDDPHVGQVLKRKCRACNTRYTVTIRKGATSGRYGVPVIKAVWEEL